MRINRGSYFISGGILALFVLAYIMYSLFFFIVKEDEQVVIKDFGKALDDPIQEAGLHFKFPWQNTYYFTKKIIYWDGPEQKMPIGNGEYITVNSTCRWKITNPVVFLEKFNSEQNATATIQSLINSAVTNVLAKHALKAIIRENNKILEPLVELKRGITNDQYDIILNMLDSGKTLKEILNKENKLLDDYFRKWDEIEEYDKDHYVLINTQKTLSEQIYEEINNKWLDVRSQGRGRITDEIFELANEKLTQIQTETIQVVQPDGSIKEEKLFRKALEISDVRLRQVMFDRSVLDAVFQRMITEQQTIAQKYRGIGQRQKEEILGTLEQRIQQQYGLAAKLVREVEGNGLREQAQLWADAFAEDQGFYQFFRFMKRLESQKEAISSQDTIVISKDDPFFNFLTNSWDSDF